MERHFHSCFFNVQQDPWVWVARGSLPWLCSLQPSPFLSTLGRHCSYFVHKKWKSNIRGSDESPTASPVFPQCLEFLWSSDIPGDTNKKIPRFIHQPWSLSWCFYYRGTFIAKPRHKASLSLLEHTSFLDKRQQQVCIWPDQLTALRLLQTESLYLGDTSILECHLSF